MTGSQDLRSLLGARVRFHAANDVIEGEVVGAGPHLVCVQTDAGRRWVVDRYSIHIVTEDEAK